MRILRVLQRNQIGQVVTGANLPINAFEWKAVPSKYNGNESAEILHFKDSLYFFRFELDLGERWTFECCPGRDRNIMSECAGSWERQYIEFSEWVDRLLQELNLLDPWDQIMSYLPDSETFLETGQVNSQFSYQEVQQIVSALDRLQVKIQEQFLLVDEQLKVLRDKIDYIKEAAKKQGRIDWKNLSLGAIIQLAIDLTLSPDKRQLFWNIVKESFQVLFLVFQ